MSARSLILVFLFVCNNAMIDTFNHLKIGFEVHSVHQFKFDKGGYLEMHGDFSQPDKSEEVTTKEQVNDHKDKDDNEDEDEEEDESAIRLYHCTDKEIENLNKYNSMHKLCENIEDFECSYNLLINEENSKQDIFYSFHSLKKQVFFSLLLPSLFLQKQCYKILSG